MEEEEGRERGYGELVALEEAALELGAVAEANHELRRVVARRRLFIDHIGKGRTPVWKINERRER